jgi:hypothetical protein
MPESLLFLVGVNFCLKEPNILSSSSNFRTFFIPLTSLLDVGRLDSWADPNRSNLRCSVFHRISGLTSNGMENNIIILFQCYYNRHLVTKLKSDIAAHISLKLETKQYFDFSLTVAVRLLCQEQISQLGNLLVKILFSRSSILLCYDNQH